MDRYIDRPERKTAVRRDRQIDAHGKKERQMMGDRKRETVGEIDSESNIGEKRDRIRRMADR